MTHSRQQDTTVCLRRLRGGSLSFYTASLLLPKAIRTPAAALYGFCRVADDAIDFADDPVSALQELRLRLDDIYSDTSIALPEDRAFAHTVKAYSIPRDFPEGLLEGFAWDAEGKEYETIADLHDYSARVAGTVGAMMATIMGARSEQAIARACELGIAMQLTNIARDVGEDARLGRLYLPREWFREMGIEPDEWLANPEFSEQIATLVQRLLDNAEQLYRQAEKGVVFLPATCRPAIVAAAMIYREIGCELLRRDGDSVSQRTVVPTGRKIFLLSCSLARATTLKQNHPVVPHQASLFLVEAMTSTTPEKSEEMEQDWNPIPWWNVKQQIISVIDLFERLERRDQSARMQSAN